MLFEARLAVNSDRQASSATRYLGHFLRDTQTKALMAELGSAQICAAVINGDGGGTYADQKGERRPMFRMTARGLSELAMSFSGDKGSGRPASSPGSSRAATIQASHRGRTPMNTDGLAPEPADTPPQPPSARKSRHPPEVHARLAEFTKNIGAALAANLNRNVLAEHSDSKPADNDGA